MLLKELDFASRIWYSDPDATTMYYNISSLMFRSLDGDRDSELAIGVFQPRHCIRDSQGGDLPRGDVFKFRMTLFREHLNRMEPIFVDPCSEKCARFVRDLALQNWTEYEVRTGNQPTLYLI